MITGIIGAMTVETDAIKSLVKDQRTERVSGVDFVIGKIGGHDVVVAQCGVGKVFSAICAQTMITKFGAQRIINSGVAGTLCEELGLLDMAISTSVVQHDMDTTPLGDPPGLISGIDIVNIPADEKLGDSIESAARALDMNCVRGVIASGDQFVGDSEKKKYIRDTFGAIACEMEGAAIGHVCYVNGVDFAVIRCISDNADDSAGTMEYPELCKIAAQRSQKLIEKFFE